MRTTLYFGGGRSSWIGSGSPMSMRDIPGSKCSRRSSPRPKRSKCRDRCYAGALKCLGIGPNEAQRRKSMQFFERGTEAFRDRQQFEMPVSHRAARTMVPAPASPCILACRSNGHAWVSAIVCIATVIDPAGESKFEAEAFDILSKSLCDQVTKIR